METEWLCAAYFNCLQPVHLLGHLCGSSLLGGAHTETYRVYDLVTICMSPVSPISQLQLWDTLNKCISVKETFWCPQVTATFSDHIACVRAVSDRRRSSPLSAQPSSLCPKQWERLSSQSMAKTAKWENTSRTVSSYSHENPLGFSKFRSSVAYRAGKTQTFQTLSLSGFAMRDPTVSLQNAVIQHLLLYIYYDKHLIHVHLFSEVLSFYTSYQSQYEKKVLCSSLLQP